MSEHRIAWTLHNFEMEQTIIRLRNTRNRLLDRNNGKFPGAEAIETYRDEIRRLENELQESRHQCDMLTSMLYRIARDAFNLDDTISGEGYDAYVIRNVNQLRDEIGRLERENASLADRLSGAELERDRLGAELEATKPYVSCRTPISG